MSNSSSSKRWRPPLAVVLAALFGSLILIAVASVWLFSMSVAGRNTVELIQDLTDVVMLTIVSRIDTLLRPAEAQASYLSRQIAGGKIGPGLPGEPGGPPPGSRVGDDPAHSGRRGSLETNRSTPEKHTAGLGVGPLEKRFTFIEADAALRA